MMKWALEKSRALFVLSIVPSHSVEIVGGSYSLSHGRRKMNTQRHSIPSPGTCAIASMLCFALTSAMLSQPLQWRTILPLKNCGADSSIYSVHMADALHCFAVGEDGAAHRSTDGGVTWSAMPVGGSADLYSVAFSTLSDGIICGDSGTVLRTSDGGASWWLRALPGFETRALYSISWMDSATAIICGGASAIAHGQLGLPDGFILRSSDAGATWTVVHADGAQFFWRAAVSPDGSTVRTTSYGPLAGGGILASSDRGRTWLQEATQLPFLPHDIACTTASGDTVFFACGGSPGSLAAAGGAAMKRNRDAWSVLPSIPAAGFFWSVTGRRNAPNAIASFGTQSGQIWSRSDRKSVV